MEFRVGNVPDLNGLADASFDIVLDGHCLHCIIGEDRRLCLDSVFRVLKPGGWLLVFTMCRGDIPVTVEGFDVVSGMVVNPKGMPTRYLGRPDSILEEVSDAGLRVCHSHTRPPSKPEEQGVADLVIYARKPGPA